MGRNATRSNCNSRSVVFPIKLVSLMHGYMLLLFSALYLFKHVQPAKRPRAGTAITQGPVLRPLSRSPNAPPEARQVGRGDE